MEENKKVRPHFNWVDAVIVLLVLLAAASALLLRGKSTGSLQKTSTMRYTVELKNVPQETVDRLVLGGSVFRSTDSVYLGTLASFKTEPYTQMEYAPGQGTFVTYPCEGRYFLYLTIENEGYETAESIVIGGVPIRVGQELFVKGKGYAGGSYVVGIDTLNAPTQDSAATPAGTTVLTYTAEIRDVRAFTTDALHVGDRIYEQKTGALLGVISDVALTPSYEWRVNADGETVRAEREGRSIALLTVESACTETNDAYFLDGRSEWKSGAEVQIESKYVSCQLCYRELLHVGDGENA